MNQNSYLFTADRSNCNLFPILISQTPKKNSRLWTLEDIVTLKNFKITLKVCFDAELKLIKIQSSFCFVVFGIFRRRIILMTHNRHPKFEYNSEHIIVYTKHISPYISVVSSGLMRLLQKIAVPTVNAILRK